MKKDNKYELAVFEDNDNANLVEYSKQMQESIEKALDENKGEKGDKGDKGDTGDTLPAGGTTGQVLTKNSETDGDVEWSTVEGNEVFIGNEADAPATAKIVIDEDEMDWEDEEDKTVVIEFTTASTAGGDSNLIAYPSGFSRDNCYVSGVLFWREYPNNETVTTWYCLSGNYNVRLQANGIVVNMGAGTSEQYLNKPAKIFLKKYKEA